MFLQSTGTLSRRPMWRWRTRSWNWSIILFAKTSLLPGKVHLTSFAALGLNDGTINDENCVVYEQVFILLLNTVMVIICGLQRRLPPNFTTKPPNQTCTWCYNTVWILIIIYLNREKANLLTTSLVFSLKHLIPYVACLVQSRVIKLIIIYHHCCCLFLLISKLSISDLWTDNVPFARGQIWYEVSLREMRIV